MKKKLKRWQEKFWWYLLRKFTANRSTSICGNRHVKVSMLGCMEITITFRDTRDPDGYSREDLLEMLRLIRKHEMIQNWRTPDREKCYLCDGTPVWKKSEIGSICVWQNCCTNCGAILDSSVIDE